MIRTAIWFIYFWAYMIVVMPYGLFLKRLDQKTRQEKTEKAAVKWAQRLLKLAGARVTVQGESGVTRGEPVLFVSNHQGAFDIPLLMAYLDRPFGFIAKEELETLPFVSFWMKNLRCVFIKRGNPREAIKAINTGIELLKCGHSLMVFPEGTRSKTGHLLPFKPGSLKLATKSGCSVVPITIDGSKNLMKAGSWIIQPASVTIHVHPAISAQEVAELDTQLLNDRIEDIIRQKLTLS